MIQTIPISAICSGATIPSGVQIRAKINYDTCHEYQDAMHEGAEFPPIVVFLDGAGKYILADGFHRVMAANCLHRKEISAEVREGTRSDALKYALAANARHGLPRTNLDKRRSVELALAEWPKLSDRELAKICAVGHPFVGDVRKAQLESDSSCEPATRLGADGKERRLPAKRTLPPPPPMQPRTEPEPPSEPEPSEEAEPPRVTAHTPPPPPPPPPPAVFTDETGWPVPTGLIELFRRAPEAQALLSAISTVRGALRTAQETKDPLFLEVSFSRAQAELDNAYSEVKRAKPHAVCPTCKGQVKDRCLLCHGRGLISEFTWNTVVSREAREFRFKALGRKCA